MLLSNVINACICIGQLLGQVRIDYDAMAGRKVRQEPDHFICQPKLLLTSLPAPMKTDSMY